MTSLNEYIKHKPPMQLITEFVSADGVEAHCRAQISPENLFYQEDSNGVPAHVGLELMAQTIAAGAGYRNRRDGDEIKIGFLLGSRKYTCTVPYFESGICYDIFVEEMHAESSGLSVFSCCIKHQNQIVAEARLNVYQPPDEAFFVERNYD